MWIITLGSITLTYIHWEACWRCVLYILGELTKLASWLGTYVHVCHIQIIYSWIDLNLLSLQHHWIHRTSQANTRTLGNYYQTITEHIAKWQEGLQNPHRTDSAYCHSPYILMPDLEDTGDIEDISESKLNSFLYPWTSDQEPPLISLP